MEQWELLARHHRQIVDRFIESLLDGLDLGDLQRNVMGVVLRREVEMELVPGIVAIQAVFHAADAAVLGTELPEWLDRVSAVMPADSDFLAEMGRLVDPAGNDFLEEDLGLLPGESEFRRAFDVHLWEIAPLVRSPK